MGQPLVVAAQQVDPPGLDVGQPGLADVVADDARTVIGQRQRGGQSHVAQSDDGDVSALRSSAGHGSVSAQQHLFGHSVPTQFAGSTASAPTIHTGGVPSAG